METWRGHFPVINLVLQALLKKKAETTDLSRAEGALLNGCDFWAAVGTRELPQYLGSRSGSRLLVAFEVFSEIGAVRVASALRIELGVWPDTPSPKWLLKYAQELDF